MNSPTILVIDDSAAIRKLVDNHLSQEGYRVHLAPTGEEGLRLARELRPDLILLDHQLPGTTGLEVCRKIVAHPECRAIPFVVSSTLRKQAYAEYLEIPNVVDSLHKPFQPDLLKMTVANALETAAMIISSQSSGTAVPEVIHAPDQGALCGDLRVFRPREILDFLNNGRRTGRLEIESVRDRTYFYLENGRVQCVMSPSVDPQVVAELLPDALKDLAPLLRFTMSTGFSAHVDGLVELLDRKMLDPRLLRTLLRFQAAVLTRRCLLEESKCFTFQAGQVVPTLFRRTPLDIGLAALLVEGALAVPATQRHSDDRLGWSRQGLRGQNLDRTGLSARHVQLMSVIDSNVMNASQIADKAGMPADEVSRVLDGLALADWVRCEAVEEKFMWLAYETDPTGSALLRKLSTEANSGWEGKVVRDLFGLQLLLKRTRADLLLVSVGKDEPLKVPARVAADPGIENIRHIGLIADGTHPELATHETKDLPLLVRPYSSRDVLNLLSRVEGSPEKDQSATNILRAVAALGAN